MAVLSIGKIITGIFVLMLSFALVVALLSDANLGTNNPAANTLASYNLSLIGVNKSFTSNVFNPLLSQSQSSFNTTKSFASSSSQLGFAYAFIISNFGNILALILQAPILLNVFLAQLLGGIGISTIFSGIIATLIEELMFIFIIFQGISLWMKYPLF